MFSDDESAREFLFSRINYERAAMPYGRREVGLARMRELIRRLGNPLAGIPVIHIAGTKGKGSTAAMCAALLTAAGHKTGLYTSPHLARLEERYVVDDVTIAPAELRALCNQLRPVVEALDAESASSGDPQLTFFELTTALAFLHFQQNQVECAVLEVGLGGRLDSTNVCRPCVSVITNISFDHTRQLGTTLDRIAGEKAGIIKPGVPVVSGETASPARDVIERYAAERAAPLSRLQRDFRFSYVPPVHLDHAESQGRVRFESATTNCETPLGLHGRHQAANAALALAVRDQLIAAGWNIPLLTTQQALADLRFPARIEIAGRQPTVVIDAAHNVASLKALLETVAASFDARRRMLIFAATSDKDVAGMLKLVDPFFDRVFLTRFVGNERAMPPNDLLSRAPRQSAQYQLFESPESAWTAARDNAARDDLICVSGSFFLAGELRELIAKSAVDDERQTAPGNHRLVGQAQAKPDCA